MSPAESKGMMVGVGAGGDGGKPTRTVSWKPDHEKLFQEREYDPLGRREVKTRPLDFSPWRFFGLQLTRTVYLKGSEGRLKTVGLRKTRRRRVGDVR